MKKWIEFSKPMKYEVTAIQNGEQYEVEKALKIQ